MDIHEFAGATKTVFLGAVEVIQHRNDGNEDIESLFDYVEEFRLAMRSWQALPDKDVYRKLWESKSKSQPTTFGNYHLVGNSALDVAIKFAESVSHCVEVANAFASGDSKKWPAWIPHMIGMTFNLDGWTPAKMMRDKELILRSMDIELADATRRWTPMDERNAWLLSEFCKGTPHKQIKTDLDKRTQWEPIESDAGIRAAIKSHCAKYEIELPKTRRKGRPVTKRK